MSPKKSRPAKKHGLFALTAIPLLICGGAVVGLATLSQSGSEAEATKKATDSLYAQTEATKARIKELVDTSKPLRDSVQTVPYHLPNTYVAQLTQNGAAQWDVLLDSRHTSGGGLQAVDVRLKTCVRYVMTSQFQLAAPKALSCPEGATTPQQLQEKSYATSILLDQSKLQ